MLLWIAIGGYLFGVLGVAVALGARLRIASLERERVQYRRMYRGALRGERSLARTDVENRPLPKARPLRQ
jgi:hypothetical protein